MTSSRNFLGEYYTYPSHKNYFNQRVFQRALEFLKKCLFSFEADSATEDLLPDIWFYLGNINQRNLTLHFWVTYIIKTADELKSYKSPCFCSIHSK